MTLEEYNDYMASLAAAKQSPKNDIIIKSNVSANGNLNYLNVDHVDVEPPPALIQPPVKLPVQPLPLPLPLPAHNINSNLDQSLKKSNPGLLNLQMALEKSNNVVPLPKKMAKATPAENQNQEQQPALFRILSKDFKQNALNLSPAGNVADMEKTISSLVTGNPGLSGSDGSMSAGGGMGGQPHTCRSQGGSHFSAVGEPNQKHAVGVLQATRPVGGGRERG